MSDQNFDSKLIQRLLSEIENLRELLRGRDKPFLNLDEASQYLALSKATIYSYTSKNIIPYYKLQDRRLYFKIDDLNDWILSKNNKYYSQKEIEFEAKKRIAHGR